jgi:hypothetical protein
MLVTTLEGDDYFMFIRDCQAVFRDQLLPRWIVSPHAESIHLVALLLRMLPVSGLSFACGLTVSCA